MVTWKQSWNVVWQNNSLKGYSTLLSKLVPFNNLKKYGKEYIIYNVSYFLSNSCCIVWPQSNKHIVHFWKMQIIWMCTSAKGDKTFLSMPCHWVYWKAICFAINEYCIEKNYTLLLFMKWKMIVNHGCLCLRIIQRLEAWFL